MQSNRYKIEENETLLTEIINQIDYEIRCIQRFGQFFEKSIWMLFYEYFPQKVFEMVNDWKYQVLGYSNITTQIVTQIERLTVITGNIFHGIIRTKYFWEIFIQFYHNHEKNKVMDSDMIARMLKQKDSDGNTVLHLLSKVNTYLEFDSIYR